MLVYLLDELYGVLMGHAQIAQFAQQLPQILLQIFPAGGVCVRRAADEAALSGYGINVSLLFQLVVGPLDGVGVDGQLGGHRPDGGQLLVLRHGAGDDHPPQSVLDLLINGTGVPIIQCQHIGLV